MEVDRPFPNNLETRYNFIEDEQNETQKATKSPTFGIRIDCNYCDFKRLWFCQSRYGRDQSEHRALDKPAKRTGGSEQDSDRRDVYGRLVRVLPVRVASDRKTRLGTRLGKTSGFAIPF